MTPLGSIASFGECPDCGCKECRWITGQNVYVFDCDFSMEWFSNTKKAILYKVIRECSAIPIEVLTVYEVE